MTNTSKLGDGSLTAQEFHEMRVTLEGAQPLYDESEMAYVIRRRGDIQARGETVKECYHRYRGWLK